MASLTVASFAMNVELHEGMFPQDVLFLHGNLASNRWWTPAVEVWKKMAQPNHTGRAVLAEWRGCGKSAPPRVEAELHPAVLAADYVELARQLKLKRTVLVGHSTGGLIAMYAMLQAPELFTGAVLLDPVSAKGVKFEQAMYDAFTQMSQNRDFCAAVLGSTIHQNHAGDPGFQQLVDDAFGLAKLNWHGVVRQLETVDVTQELSKISQPILILHGKHDAIIPIEDSQKLVAQLPNAKLVELEKQGHSTNFENPRLFVELVNGFIGQLGAGKSALHEASAIASL